MNNKKILDKSISVNFNKKEIENTQKIQLPDDVIKYLSESGALQSFPDELFQKYLRKNDLKSLKTSLTEKWKRNLEKNSVCKDCIGDSNNMNDKCNCFPHWLGYSIMFMYAGKLFVSIIESNQKTLRKIIKEKLAILFFTKAFIFQGQNTYFRVGDMVKLALKESLKEVSNQLQNLETHAAYYMATQNLATIKENLILSDLGEPVFKDVLGINKKFWKNKTKQLSSKKEFENPIIEKHKISGFKGNLTNPQLDLLFEKLKGNFISIQSDKECFKAIFNEKTVNGIIIWIKKAKNKYPNKLALIDLFELTGIPRSTNDFRIKINKIFVNEDQESINLTPSNLDNSKSNPHSEFYIELQNIINSL